MAEASKKKSLRDVFEGLTKDIGNRIFFRIGGNKPGVVWNMDTGWQRNGESCQFNTRPTGNRPGKELAQFIYYFFYIKEFFL
jgi:hypothetical protein